MGRVIHLRLLFCYSLLFVPFKKQLVTGNCESGKFVNLSQVFSKELLFLIRSLQNINPDNNCLLWSY